LEAGSENFPEGFLAALSGFRYSPSPAAGLRHALNPGRTCFASIRSKLVNLGFFCKNSSALAASHSVVFHSQPGRFLQKVLVIPKAFSVPLAAGINSIAWQ